MNVLKGKEVFLIVLFIIGISGTAMASGDVDIDLRCNSPSASIKNTIGNNSYEGIAKRYTWSSSSYFSNYDSDGNYNPIYRLSEDGYVDVGYRDIKPYGFSQKQPLHIILELCYNRHMRGENSDKEAVIEPLRRKRDAMQNHLDERGRRIWAAVRRKHWDTATPQNSFKRFRLWFGVTIVHEATGMSRSAITQGIAEMAHPQDAAPPDRARLFGGGRKKNQ